MTFDDPFSFLASPCYIALMSSLPLPYLVVGIRSYLRLCCIKVGGLGERGIGGSEGCEDVVSGVFLSGMILWSVCSFPGKAWRQSV
jgi:hypothetical protein